MTKTCVAVACLIIAGILSGADAQVLQELTVCVGEFESTCKGEFPNRNVEWYGCGNTGANAICFRYCGKREGPTTCSQTRLAGPSSGNRCGYSWVTVRCYGGN
jgi:hypothetical protein